ncbi:MAG: hypothetical protein ACLQF1_21385 [Methyloceanibacter sp.]|jgi:hypothetical protein
MDPSPDIRFRALKLKAGTQMQSLLTIGRVVPFSGADPTFVQRGPWYALAPTEFATLTEGASNPDEDPTLARTVVAISIPDSLRQACRELAFREAHTFPDYPWSRGISMRSLEDAPPCVRDVFAYLRGFIDIRSCSRAVLLVDPCNQEGTTLEKRTGLRVGLHVDNFDPVPPSRRHEVSARVSINIGDGIRHFLVVPLTLNRMLDYVSFPYSESASFFASRLGTCFLTKHPDYPVFRLALPPGFGYLAPTQNCVHDGSTSGNMEPDVVLTFNAHLRVLAQSERLGVEV